MEKDLVVRRERWRIQQLWTATVGLFPGLYLLITVARFLRHRDDGAADRSLVDGREFFGGGFDVINLNDHLGFLWLDLKSAKVYL